MSDLVEKMRAVAEQMPAYSNTEYGYQTWRSLMGTAADRIEHLESALSEIASGLSVRTGYEIANEALGRPITDEESAGLGA